MCFDNPVQSHQKDVDDPMESRKDLLKLSCHAEAKCDENPSEKIRY